MNNNKKNIEELPIRGIYQRHLDEQKKSLIKTLKETKPAEFQIFQILSDKIDKLSDKVDNLIKITKIIEYHVRQFP